MLLYDRHYYKLLNKFYKIINIVLITVTPTVLNSY